MKKNYHFLGLCLFVLALSFSFLSCSDADSFEDDIAAEANVELVSDVVSDDDVSFRANDGIGGPDGPIGIGFWGYHTKLTLSTHHPDFGFPNGSAMSMH